MFYDPQGQRDIRREPAPIICWSRMQAEAGQGLERILVRKELERRTCGGIFFWGVGNAPGSEPARLARAKVPVEAIFSVMKSRPKTQDVQVAELNVWRAYIDEFGMERELPAGSLVTSRAPAPLARARAHYALMCRSERAIGLEDLGPFNPKAFRNVGGRGAPVGASQVTALLRLTDPRACGDASYRANVRAKLTGGYWVRLANPVRLESTEAKAVIEQLEDVSQMSESDWLKLITDLRHRPSVQSQSTLFDRAKNEFAPETPFV